jgi:hypothetical protein
MRDSRLLLLDMSRFLPMSFRLILDIYRIFIIESRCVAVTREYLLRAQNRRGRRRLEWGGLHIKHLLNPRNLIL